MKNPNTKYAVMKLLEDVETESPITGKTNITKLAGVDGFIPVYNKMEDAVKSSCDGKYGVLPITIPDLS